MSKSTAGRLVAQRSSGDFDFRKTAGRNTEAHSSKLTNLTDTRASPLEPGRRSVHGVPNAGVRRKCSQNDSKPPGIECGGFFPRMRILAPLTLRVLRVACFLAASPPAQRLKPGKSLTIRPWHDSPEQPSETESRAAAGPPLTSCRNAVSPRTTK